MPIEPGSMLGSYEIHDLVGVGVTGAVYRAYHVGLARPAAVRVLPAIAVDPEAKARFRREAEVITGLRHPNLLHLFDFGDHLGTPYLVAEWMPGGSLGDRLKAGANHKHSTSLQLLAGIAAALDFAHGQGIVHGDVKPAGVLLDGSGRPIIADLGLVNLVQGFSGTGVGSDTTENPAYLAPERVMGSPAGSPADLYALATMAYELLAGAVPFEGEGTLEILYAQVHREPPAASRLNADLPPAVDAALARGLAKDPLARWQSGNALVASLEAAFASAPVATVEAVVPAAPVVAAAPAIPAAPAETEGEAARPAAGRLGPGTLVGAVGGILVLAALLILLALVAQIHPAVVP
jgi:serine/threonine protein kinase